MLGVISKAEILTHPLVTIECFGWAVFFRAVFAGKNQSFLSLLNEAGVFQQPELPVTEFIGRCVELERRASRMYELLAFRYDPPHPAREFFNHLARQEDAHAELLELCRATASRNRWREHVIDTWLQNVPVTECLLEDAEVAVRQHESLADALRVVIRVESSQINGLFTSVVNATDTRLARVFSAFRNAVREHLAYIQFRIPELEPSLKPDCQRLQVTK